ncbi:MAG: ATP-dependent Clp protease ATP-binding subunit ClpA, partial [Candidatus Hydrogenedentes bacterium]|nr:ATP-dependent Clp protease ATP-binding subunit ClpA [Candidatus Hydrogenedentota bacterium]
MISKDLETALTSALGEARRRRHEYLCAEHILYALLDDEQGRSILVNCGADIDRLRGHLDGFLENDVERVPEGHDLVVQQTVGFERLMQRALTHVHYSGKSEVEAGDILAAIFEEDGSHAAYYLESEGVARLDVLNYISHGVSKAGPGDDRADWRTEGEGEEEDAKRQAKRDPLEAYTVSLSELAARGKIDPLIGRELELRRAVRVLCRRRKNNPVFVGEPGVGKTAIVEGMALKVHEGQVPKVLLGVEILRLDLAALLAGTQFRGDMEARVKAVVNALLERDNVILFIDEIHTVVGAGSTRGSDVDVSSILKPVLASGDLRCIGATTYEEYKNGFDKDRALSRRFQKIDIVEPTVEETVQILRGLRSRYEEHHGIHYTDSALRAAADLASKHINDRFLPDKAIDVIDEAGAQVRISSQSQRKTIRPLDIEKIVAEMARIPTRTVSTDDKERLESLEDDIKSVIFGQDEAVHKIATSIKRSRAGLGDPDRPVGSFLFTGPTGVGKTELAKQLASVLGVQFIRFDMSEYMEPHAVSRLIGSPPGYVGFDQGGLLTEEIRKHPHCVLLLDEMEKAHPDIYNILLQVMDHATLTDNAGKQADFRNVVLVMTSNAGARSLESNVIGFASAQDAARGKSIKAIEKAFSPEFRNRLDAIVAFDALPMEVVLKIVDKFVRQLQVKLDDRKVGVKVTGPARQWLADRGYEPKLGARPLGRLMQREIEDR